MKQGSFATPVAIGLGSNLGDRLGCLAGAVQGLESVLEAPVVSSIYETDPVGFEGQARFLNACVIGVTGLAPMDLLHTLQSLEREGGRVRSGPRFGPRSIDLDLLLFGESVIESRDLTIPHPRMLQRAFVLVPLAEIAADWRVPGSSDSVGTLAERANDASVRRLGPLRELVVAREIE